MSRFSRVLNSVLSPMDIALTRRTTLDRTRAAWAAACKDLEDARSALDKASAELDVLRHALNAQQSAAAAAAEPSTSMSGKLGELQRQLIRHQTASRWSVIDAFERRLAETLGTRACPLCNTTAESSLFKDYETHCIFGGGVLRRHQCPACDLIFGPEKMLELSSPELSQEYEWHYTVYEEGDSTEAEIRAFHSLRPRRDGLYVNYGAGAWSRSVPLLREQGWNVLAYEPHGSASSGADWVLRSEAEMEGRRFDGLFSNNVLEHLRHPVEDLRRMKRWLSPGALMAHATPCYEYLYEYTRFHLFFYLGRSRELLARRANLAIEQYEVDGHFMNLVLSPLPGSD